MFAIYDRLGCRFRDSLENLRKVRKLKRRPGPQLRSNISESETQYTPRIAADSADVKIEGKTPSVKALQAYREMLKINEREPIYHACQLMSYPVCTVRVEMDIVDAQRYFQEQGFHQMPVMSAEQRIVGMLTMENLLQVIIIDGDQVRYLKSKRVADVMSQEVITADPVSDIRRVAQVMQEYRLHGIPIVDELDALIGIVSRSDILRAVIKDPPLNMWS